MSVRISLLPQEERLTVQVEGRLEAGDAVELKENYGESAAELTLDLAGLLSADETALEVLIALRDAGAQLKGASTYVRYLLERVAALDLTIPGLAQPRLN